MLLTQIRAGHRVSPTRRIPAAKRRHGDRRLADGVADQGCRRHRHRRLEESRGIFRSAVAPSAFATSSSSGNAAPATRPSWSRDRLAFLADIGAVLTSSLDYGETLNRAVHLALPRLGDYCNVVITDEQGRMRHVAWGHVVRAKEPILRELALRLIERPTPGGMTFRRTVISTGKTLVMPHDALVKAATDAQPFDRRPSRMAVSAAAVAYIGVPLYVRGRAVGVMSFGTSEREFAARVHRRGHRHGGRVRPSRVAGRRERPPVPPGRRVEPAEGRVPRDGFARAPYAARRRDGVGREMLANGQLSPDRAKQAIDAIERNAQAQAKLVDDILDVARGAARQRRARDAAARSPRRSRTAASKRSRRPRPGKKIAVRCGHGRTGGGGRDQGRLRQVVWNLLSNAVKFTPAGGRVTVRVGASDGQAELLVTDTGMGISDAFLPYVLRQVPAGRRVIFNRQHGGLGLGLAIAQPTDRVARRLDRSTQRGRKAPARPSRAAAARNPRRRPLSAAAGASAAARHVTDHCTRARLRRRALRAATRRDTASITSA
jgi:anti-sigma regulatory factor (Ser/Thr protein kinase)